MSGPNVTVSDSVVCTATEIVKRGNNLFLCPAAGMKFSNKSDNLTYDKIKLIIQPNYDAIKDPTDLKAKAAVDKVVDQMQI